MWVNPISNFFSQINIVSQCLTVNVLVDAQEFEWKNLQFLHFPSLADLVIQPFGVQITSHHSKRISMNIIGNNMFFPEAV